MFKMLGKLHKPLLRYPKFWYKLQSVGIKMAFNEYKPCKQKKGAVIIMHCIMGAKENWHNFAKKVCDPTNRTFYCVDARNHGKSPFTKEHGSMVMSGDVETFVKVHKLGRVSVIGHGMGGRTMMLFALKNPSLVESAIIVDISPVAIPDDYLKLEQIFVIMKGADIPNTLLIKDGREMMEEIFCKVVGDENAKFLSQNLHKNAEGNFYWGINIDALKENLRPFSNFGSYLSNDDKPFDKPVMFVCGKDSNFVNSDSHSSISALFPQATMHWLNATHLVHLEQPGQLKELVINFLNR